MKKVWIVLVTAAFLAGTFDMADAASGRDYISIVGSSTVYPFATVVAEQFGKTTSFKTPKIESTGSGGGLKLFCAGVGVEHPDITNASRRIKSSEFENCQANGVSVFRRQSLELCRYPNCSSPLCNDQDMILHLA